MAIVEAAYYYNVYMGREVAECDFAALEAIAEDVIGAMTRWQATADTIAGLSALQQTHVRKAICAQMDYFALNGLDSIVGGSDRGFTVGRVSISGKSGSDLTGKGAMADSIAPLAVMYLEQTGLMNPSVPVAPAEPLIGGWF